MEEAFFGNHTPRPYTVEPCNSFSIPGPGETPSDCAGKGSYVRRHEHPEFLVRDHLCITAHRGCDTRQSTSQCFEKHVGRTLPGSREAEQVCCTVPVSQNIR